MRGLLLSVVLMLICAPLTNELERIPAKAENFYSKQNLRLLSEWLLLSHDDVLKGFEKPFVEKANTLPSPTIVVNLASRELTLLMGATPIKTYPVTVGSLKHKTPLGDHKIEKMIWNPTWYPPDSDWAKDEEETPPGPGNPLGKVKIPLGKQILVHGTNQPKKIGRAASHGCIRMKNEDAMEIAWWMQGHYSEKSDLEYLEKYQKSWRRSHWVSLTEKIPLRIIYDIIEIQDETITIHPDIYRRHPDPWTLLAEQLAPLGIDLNDINPAQLPDHLAVKESTNVPILNAIYDAEQSDVRLAFKRSQRVDDS